MASLSTPSLLLCQSFSKNSRCLWYSCIRKYTKKYNYNLNDLIDWKKKTNLAFGGPRKLTKTGKLRKSKINENEHLQRTLETMSAQCNHFRSRYSEINDELWDNGCEKPNSIMKSSDISDTEIPKEIFNKHDPLHYSDNVQKSFRHTAGFDNIYNDINPTAKRAKNASFSTSYELQKQDSFVKKFSNNSSKIKSHSSKHSNKSSDDEQTDIHKESNNDDIHIPVISPIPSRDDNMQKSYNESVASRSSKSGQKHPFQSKALPLEPPNSFKLINDIPLIFAEHSFGEQMDNNILQFKTDVESLALRMMPSVKSILNKTMPDLNRFFLNRWREGMIKELGEQGFKAHQDATIKRGVNLHANVLELLSGKPLSDIQVMPDNEGHWVSLQTAIKYISGVKALEEDLRHSALMYRGVADCVAKYKDVLCVIDWKTSKKPRPLLKNTYDDPIQVAAYMGLLNANKENFKKYGGANHGLLVVIYPDGSPAHIHLMNKALCEQYWQDWLGRLYYYYQLVYTEKFGS